MISSSSRTRRATSSASWIRRARERRRIPEEDVGWGDLSSLKRQGRGVDAVPQPGGLGPVVEDMAQVGTAVGALDLDPSHEQASVLLFPNVFLLDRFPETRPPRPRVEFGLRGKERLSADDASVEARLVVVPVFARERSLGSLVDADVVLLRREPLAERRLVQLLHVLVDRVHEDVVDHAGLPVSGLQSPDASSGTAGRFEQRIVDAGYFLELPSEQAGIELLEFLRFLDVDLHVDDASGLRLFGHRYIPEHSRSQPDI